MNVSVIESDRTCLTQVSSNPIHIMRSSAAKLGCGSKSQPWKMEAPAGQQINVSLLDFGSTMLLTESDRRQRQHEDQYGYIIDKSASSKNISIHHRHNERFQMIHISSSNILEIILSASVQNEDNLSNFLLGFKGISLLTFLYFFFFISMQSAVDSEQNKITDEVRVKLIENQINE